MASLLNSRMSFFCRSQIPQEVPRQQGDVVLSIAQRRNGLG